MGAARQNGLGALNRRTFCLVHIYILMTSELSSLFPETGGHIIYGVHKAFGTFWSLQNSLWTFYTSTLDNALYPVMLGLFGELNKRERLVRQ